MYTGYIFDAPQAGIVYILDKLKVEFQFLLNINVHIGGSLVLRSRKILLRKATLFPMLSRTQKLGAIGFSVNAILRGHPPAEHASKNMHPFPADLMFFYFSLKWGISANSRKKLAFLLLKEAAF